MKGRHPQPAKAGHRSLESLTEKEKWNSMNPAKRLQYIWDYYKLPIVILCIILYLIGYTAYRRSTHRDSLLYASLINVAASDALTQQLSDGFLDYMDADTRHTTCTLGTGWYLTEDTSSEYFEYTYATRMKVLASIDSEQLDVVLMNQEAFDAFSQNGYLCNLEELLQEDAGLYQAAAPYLTTNLEILEDNLDELKADPSLEYESTTAEYPMAADLSECGILKDAGFEDHVYFGIIKNTPRRETAVEYLRYLISG